MQNICLNPPLVEAGAHGASARHMRGAMYLCGYGVECMFEAYLIAQNQPLQRLSDVLLELRKVDPNVRDICGASGHDLPYLLILTGLEARRDKQRKIQMSLCAKWRSSWRYNAEPTDEASAKAMVLAARELANWINSQI